MNKNIFLIFLVVNLFMLEQMDISARTIEISVSVNSEITPNNITIEKEGSVSPISFQREATITIANQITYNATLELESLDSSEDISQLRQSYLLSAYWSSPPDHPTEQIYLSFFYNTPNRLQIPIYRKECDYRDTDLSAIDSLGSSFYDRLQKYCRARMFHRHWRYQNHQPDHCVAIRSARLWFDAAADLAKLEHSLFRMDPEIIRIFDDYESRARNDKKFKSVYREYVRDGFISDTLKEVYSTQYAFVRDIPSLIKQNLKEAKLLNQYAFDSLTQEPKEFQIEIVRRQGINLDLLQANSAYINTLELEASM